MKLNICEVKCIHSLKKKKALKHCFIIYAFFFSSVQRRVTFPPDYENMFVQHAEVKNHQAFAQFVQRVGLGLMVFSR